MEKADFLRLTAPRWNVDQLSVQDGMNPNFSSPTNKALFLSEGIWNDHFKEFKQQNNMETFQHRNTGNIFSVFQELDRSLFQR